MNFINCTASSSTTLMRKTIIFWSDNIAGHITSLLRSTAGTTAVLEEGFKELLKNYYEKFLNINANFKKANLPISCYQDFLRTNAGLINLFERIKYEGFSGYPVLQQSVFHYIYESRYVNAIFGAKNTNGNLLITTCFLPFLNNSLNCIYNQMYFWSIIGSMHPSLLMGNNVFYNAVNGYAKEFLTEVCNRFNAINYNLSSLKKSVKRSEVAKIFEMFISLNREYLDFLTCVRKINPKIFTAVSVTHLPESFLSAVDHQIAEHTLVAQINENIKKLIL